MIILFNFHFPRALTKTWCFIHFDMQHRAYSPNQLKMYMGIPAAAFIEDLLVTMFLKAKYLVSVIAVSILVINFYI